MLNFYINTRFFFPASNSTFFFDCQQFKSGCFLILQGYLSSLSMKAFSYINLDGIVAGKG